MKTGLWLILLLAAAAACSKPEPEHKDERSSFQLMAEGIGDEPPCSKEIPSEWAPSLPVPVLVERRLHYRVFFRGWERGPNSEIEIRDAEGDALFAADGKVLECGQRGRKGRVIPDAGLPTADREAFDARVRALYGSIEELGRLYARGMPVLGADRARVEAFAREFFALTPSGHSASYRALSPEFWAWVEKNGGAAPAK